MKTSDLRLRILKMFRTEEFHGYEVHRKLTVQGMKVEIGNLYRTLNKMLAEGLLEAHWEKSKIGPNKKLYKIGKKGRKQLDRLILDAIETIHAFYAEYLTDLPLRTNVFEILFRKLGKDLKKNSVVALIASCNSPIYDMMLKVWRTGRLGSSVYVIAPRFANVEVHFEKLTTLKGWYDDVPLKDKSIDLLMMNMPKKGSLEKAVKEWRRVAKENGRVLILAPAILLHKRGDPLSMGDFVEKLEHQMLEKQDFIDHEYLQNLLMGQFEKIEEKQIAHMTAIIASKPRAPVPLTSNLAP